MEENKNLENAVECRICNLKSHDLTSHISRIHGGVESYCAVFPGAQIRSEKYLAGQSDRIKGSKNPAYQHGGRLSPFSKNFIHADEIDITKLYEQVASSRKQNNNDTTSLEYYTKRGLSEEEAKTALSKRQSTFSLEKCITKHGVAEGKRVWVERQEKWLKSYKKQNYSKISQKLFWGIYTKLEIKHNIFFATLNTETMGSDYSGKNFESIISTESGSFRPDFIFNNKKIIEFDGDYWHYDRYTSTNTNNIRDTKRQHILENMGYQVMRVRERDYNANPEQVLEDCICFLNK